MRHYCNQCKKTITPAVYNYSMNHYNHALCRAHQPKNNTSNNEKSGLEELGNFFSQIGKVISFLNEKGGSGLILTVLGAVIILYNLLMFNVWTIVVGGIILGVGIFLLIKKEQNK